MVGTQVGMAGGPCPQGAYGLLGGETDKAATYTGLRKTQPGGKWEGHPD